MDGVEYARRIEYCWALASGVWCVGWDVWLAADGVTCGGCMWMALGCNNNESFQSRPAHSRRLVFYYYYYLHLFSS